MADDTTQSPLPVDVLTELVNAGALSKDTMDKWHKHFNAPDQASGPEAAASTVVDLAAKDPVLDQTLSAIPKVVSERAAESTPVSPSTEPDRSAWAQNAVQEMNSKLGSSDPESLQQMAVGVLGRKLTDAEMAAAFPPAQGTPSALPGPTPAPTPIPSASPSGNFLPTANAGLPPPASPIPPTVDPSVTKGPNTIGQHGGVGFKPAPQANGNSVWEQVLDRNTKNMQRLYDATQAQGQDYLDIAQAKANQAREIQNAYDTQANVVKGISAATADSLNTRLQQEADSKAIIEKSIDEGSKLSIDPNHFWASRDTEQKILLGIGLFLGGFAKDGNPALKIIDNAISRDIDAQKAAISQARFKTEKLQNAYNAQHQIFQDSYQTQLATEAAAYKRVQLTLDGIIAGSSAPEAIAQGKLLKDTIDQKYAETIAALGQTSPIVRGALELQNEPVNLDKNPAAIAPLMSTGQGEVAGGVGVVRKGKASEVQAAHTAYMDMQSNIERLRKVISNPKAFSSADQRGQIQALIATMNTEYQLVNKKRVGQNVVADALGGSSEADPTLPNYIYRALRGQISGNPINSGLNTLQRSLEDDWLNMINANALGVKDGIQQERQRIMFRDKKEKVPQSQQTFSNEDRIGPSVDSPQGSQ